MTSSSPPIMVVDRMLSVFDLITGDAPGPEWISLECDRKAAYGCGELGNKLFKGLTLYVRRIGCADVSSCISMRLSPEALRSIQEELDVPVELQGLDNGLLPSVKAFIMTADKGIIVIIATFRRQDHDERVYCLVYDAEDASIYMIPYLPPIYVEAAFTVVPVPWRPAGGRGHELAVAASVVLDKPSGPERGRLCVCTPATRDSAGTGTCTPWYCSKVQSGFPSAPENIPQAFSADVMFSFAGKVFWADLWQGVAYSDLGQGGSVVDVAYISLPDEHQIVLASLPEDTKVDPAKLSRTVGCVNGSIVFICIIRAQPRRAGNELLKVWTLDLDRKLWVEDKVFTCPWEELWKKASVMNDGLLRGNRPLEPQFPVLMPDGALCVLLRKRYSHGRSRVSVNRPDYICSFDISNKSCLWVGQVRSYYNVHHPPVTMPFNFFKNCYPTPQRKRPTNKRKLPSIDKQMLVSSPVDAQ